MPSREILECWIRFDTGERAEIDRNFGSDIRDRKPVARDERLISDLLIEPLKLVLHGLVLRRSVLRKLFDASLKKVAGILERARYRPKQVQLHPPIPHLDLRLFAIVLAHQVRFRMQTFKVAANGDRLSQMGT